VLRLGDEPVVAREEARHRSDYAGGVLAGDVVFTRPRIGAPNRS
jgi:hypothetical protein